MLFLPVEAEAFGREFRGAEGLVMGAVVAVDVHVSLLRFVSLSISAKVYGLPMVRLDRVRLAALNALALPEPHIPSIAPW